MSVPGYIAGDKGGELRVPRLGEKGKDKDKVGIQFSGAVLSGEKSVEQRLREVGLRDWPAGSREERYREAGEYDAVLKDHCGCGSEGEGRQAEALVHAGRRIYVAIQ